MPSKSSFPGDTKKLRSEVIATACALPRPGLTKGTSSNVSARTRSGFLITPSGTLTIAEAVEDLTDQYLSAPVLGEPVVPEDGEMAEVLKKFKSYGKQTSELKDGREAAFELRKRVD